MDEKRLIARLAKARKDRSQVASKLNEFYDLAVPHRPRVGQRPQRHQPNHEKQNDIFDQTLQQAVADFASNSVDAYTPDYKPWVSLKPGVDTSDIGAASEENLAGDLKRYEERLYDLIRTTDFYEQQYEVFVDLAGGAGGIWIPYFPVDREISCRPILMHSLLFDEGPRNSLDGRWDEFYAPRDALTELFPGVTFKTAVTSKAKQHECKITQGIYREYTDGGARWRWCLLIDDEPQDDRELAPDAPPSIMVARWRHAPPSAWGPGAADVAMPAARTLDALGYYNLIKLGKEANPPFTYEQDNMFNPEGGIEPGTFLARRQGSKPPEPLYLPTSSQNLYFDREMLQMIVKRALFVDGPYQRGDTPPTATQWLDEKAQQQRRMMARRRIYREYVLPVLQRFAYVFSRRGELPPVRLNGRDIAVEFVSPLSKASDAEEVSSGMQLAQSAIGIFGETALASIDAYATMESWKEKLGDSTVTLSQPDEQNGLIQQLLGEGRNLVSNKAP